MKPFLVRLSIPLAAILLLAACGPSPEAIATMTASAWTPTPQPTATSTPNPLLFRDDFEGSLGEGWQWVRENNKYWNLTNNPGWLEIIARGGSVGGGNIGNLLWRQAPQGNYDLETKLNFKPTSNFQVAGLLIYESAENFIQFGRAFCGKPNCVGDGFYLDLYTNGKMSPESFATKAPNTDVVYLRLRREGNELTAYTSENGNEWKLIGRKNSEMQPLFVGFVVGQSMGSATKPAQFDYFVINALP